MASFGFSFWIGGTSNGSGTEIQASVITNDVFQIATPSTSAIVGLFHVAETLRFGWII